MVVGRHKADKKHLHAQEIESDENQAGINLSLGSRLWQVFSFQA